MSEIKQKRKKLWVLHLHQVGGEHRRPLYFEEKDEAVEKGKKIVSEGYTMRNSITGEVTFLKSKLFNGFSVAEESVLIGPHDC